jgi:hypothetical protein
MIVTIVQLQWIVIALSSLAATVATSLATVSLVLSRRALRASIPAPTVMPVYRQMLVVRMLQRDEGEYGISEIKMRRGKIQAVSDFSIRELEDILRGSWKMDPWTKAARWDHLATSIVARHTCIGGCRFRVKVKSRRDRRVRRWITVQV